MSSTNKVIHAKDTFCYRRYVCEVSKLQHMYVIGFTLLSVVKTTNTPGNILLHTRLQGVRERIA